MSTELTATSKVIVNGHEIDRPVIRPDIEQRLHLPLYDAVIDLRAGHLPNTLVTFDHEITAYQQLPTFLERARRAAEQHAVSYRDFKVGASAYAIDTTHDTVGFFFGANYKPHEGAPKYCAEMQVLDKAREAGFDKVIAMATFGPSDYGDVNELASPTLHPCADCRALFDKDPLIHNTTLFATSNEKGDIEMMLAEDLQALHEDKRPANPLLASDVQI